jgi:hypothetical protein
LRERGAFEEDPAMPVESATVTLHLVDATELRGHIRHGRGTPGRTMSNAELHTKARDMAAYGAVAVGARVTLRRRVMVILGAGPSVSARSDAPAPEDEVATV